MGNRAAIQSPGPTDTAVEQIHLVWCAQCAAVAVVTGRSGLRLHAGSEQPASLENLPTLPLTEPAVMPHLSGSDSGLHTVRLEK